MEKRKSAVRTHAQREPGRVLDISLPLGSGTAPWPGDPALELRTVASLGSGDPSQVGAVYLGLHLGTHLDAPGHVLPGGAGIGDLPLDLFLGPAWVADLSGRTDTATGQEKRKNSGAARAGHLAIIPALGQANHGSSRAIGIDELEAANIPLPCPRLLLRTGLVRRPGVFPNEFRTLSMEAAHWCLARGVRLLGLDTPSPDPADSPDLPAHRVLLGAGAPLLENLDLSGAAAGEYWLACQPLPLAGAEASPVRAVLWVP